MRLALRGRRQMILIKYLAAPIISLIAGLVLRSEYEKKHFKTTMYEIKSDKLPEGKKFRYIFLSDLHDNVYGCDNEPLVAKIRALKPDAVFIGGDMMVCKGKCDLSVTLSLLKKLTSFASVYYANGNHEARMDSERFIYGDLYDKFKRELENMGVHHMVDRNEDINPWIRLTGCGLSEKYYKHHFTVPKLPAKEISDRIGNVCNEKYEILLFHSPLFFETFRKWGADLTLCGHFHGGTIRIPFLGGVMTPQYQFFLPWCAGRFDISGKTMIVSRGLGTHSINIRLNNRPELVCVTLTC